MNAQTNVRLSPLGISSAKAMFLCCIYDHTVMSQVEICRELDMDKSTVAKMLMRLENDGFVTRTVNPDDVRSVLVSLTEKADEVIAGAQHIIDRWVADVTDCLTDAERETFYGLLDRVVEHVCRMEKGEGG